MMMTNMSLVFRPSPRRGFPDLVFTLVALLCLFGLVFGAVPKALQWGDACKKHGITRPTEECDISKGFLCQTYEQGNYCGCEIGSQWTYDKQSKECRRKVTAICFYDSEADILNQLPFNQKCHEWAECAKVNWTAITGMKKTNDIPVCQCRQGYHANKDFSACIPDRTTNSASECGSIWLHAALSALFTLAVILRR